MLLSRKDKELSIFPKAWILILCKQKGIICHQRRPLFVRGITIPCEPGLMEFSCETLVSKWRSTSATFLFTNRMNCSGQMGQS
jgi:hypothetical protein